MWKAIKIIWNDGKPLTKDQKRNMKVLSFASILNLSFAVEKLFIVIGNPLSDKVRLCVYGLMGLYVTYVAFKDYCEDIIEDNETDTQNII